MVVTVKSVAVWNRYERSGEVKYQAAGLAAVERLLALVVLAGSLYDAYHSTFALMEAV